MKDRTNSNLIFLPLIIILSITFLFSSFVLANGSENVVNVNKSGKGASDLETETSKEFTITESTKTTDGNVTVITTANIRAKNVIARNVSELKNFIKEKQEELKDQIKEFKEDIKQIYQNQNKIRIAVHSLLAMENLTGGIGQNISQIAREFNNSVQSTLRAETKIQTRNQLIKILVGGDEEVADELLQTLNKTREKIQQLEQLRLRCNCSDEVKSIIQEQIQNMEMEQTRLGQLAQVEKENKGLFGWLFRIFKK